MIIDPLGEALRELAVRTAPDDIQLIIGGGYGLVLRTLDIERENIPTLRPLPQARSTSDIDLFMNAELIIDAPRIQRLRDVLGELGYQAVEGAEYYQFKRGTTAADTVKIDILASLPHDPEKLGLVKRKERRVRPKSVEKFHAHIVPEAVSIAEYAVPVDLGGGRVYVPHPLSYVVLKLFAFRDRIGGAHKNSGISEKHAFDIYHIMAMITEQQWSESLELRLRFPDHDIMGEAQRVVREFFGSPTGVALLSFGAYARSVGIRYSELDLHGFLRDLHELFPIAES